MRSELDEIKDLLYAAMETGNFDRAKAILYQAKDTLEVETLIDLQAQIVAEYGVAL